MSEEFEHAEDLRALAAHDVPSRDQVTGLRRRLNASLRPRPAHRGMALVTAAVAAAAVAVVTSGLVSVEPEARKLTLAEGSVVEVTSGVRATAEGDGEAMVDGRHTRVVWTSGRISVEVDPAAGKRVVVSTPEAEVVVVGTAFEVERGPFGTHTSVSRGHVDVTCRGGTARALAAGDDDWCFRDAGAGLGRVLYMEQRHAPPTDRLTVIDRALAHPESLPETRELLGRRRVDALLELGRRDAAIASARDLPLPARLVELSARAETALASSCDAARPWLEALAEEGEVTGALLLVQCLAPDDREDARRVLDGITHEPLDAATTEAIDAWRSVLGRP